MRMRSEDREQLVNFLLRTLVNIKCFLPLSLLPPPPSSTSPPSACPHPIPSLTSPPPLSPTHLYRLHLSGSVGRHSMKLSEENEPGLGFQ
eukprot:757858-Hanusia_phi.AAC.2